MSDMIAWIAASAEEPAVPPGMAASGQSREQRRNARQREEISLPGLPAHQFPGNASANSFPAVNPLPAENAGDAALEDQAEPEFDRERERERRVYRGRTVAMLRRYMRYSLETGRLPSLLGREFFRATVTKYRATTFEDRVIFVHDMEICLERLDEFSRQILGRVVLQEYDHFEAARLLGCTRMTVHRKLLLALDKLSSVLVEMGLLDLLPAKAEKSCQEGETGDFPASDCDDGE